MLLWIITGYLLSVLVCFPVLRFDYYYDPFSNQKPEFERTMLAVSMVPLINLWFMFCCFHSIYLSVGARKKIKRLYKILPDDPIVKDLYEKITKKHG